MPAAPGAWRSGGRVVEADPLFGGQLAVSRPPRPGLKDLRAEREPADGTGPGLADHHVVLAGREGDPARGQGRDRFAVPIPGHQVPDPKPAIVAQRRDAAVRVRADIDIPDEAVERQGCHLAQALPVQDPDLVVAAGGHNRLARVVYCHAGDRDAEVLLAELLGLVRVIGELPERELAGFGREAGHAGPGTGGHGRRAGHEDRGAGPVAGLAFLADDQAGGWIAE